MDLLKKPQYFIFCIIVLLILLIETPIIALGYLSKPKPSDTLIVLGAKLIGREPSTMLRLRLETALTLYHANYAPTIIVSGAQGADEEVSEASVMQEYLIKQGIPTEKIFLEDQSYNTYQNLMNSQKIMSANGFRQAIIVSNASHICRSLFIAHQLGIEATGAPAPMANNAYLTIKQYAREGVAMISLLCNTR